MALGQFSLWHLADFRCGSWPIFIVAVGMFFNLVLIKYLQCV